MGGGAVGAVRKRHADREGVGAEDGPSPGRRRHELGGVGERNADRAPAGHPLDVERELAGRRGGVVGADDGDGTGVFGFFRSEVGGHDGGEHARGLVGVDHSARRRLPLHHRLGRSRRRCHHLRLVHFHQPLVVAAQLGRCHNLGLESRVRLIPADHLERLGRHGTGLVDGNIHNCGGGGRRRRSERSDGNRGRGRGAARPSAEGEGPEKRSRQHGERQVAGSFWTQPLDRL
mmetsp:Transcript_21750/g.44021  ORF Transcript_21750/g.44021 Transcript_21750/m.44021 type:complete len:232 (-) Transcript_21750:3-698(-)